MKNFFFIFLFLVLFVSAYADGSHEVEKTLDEKIKSNSILYIAIASIISLIFVFVANSMRKQPHFTNAKKRFLFIGIITPVILATIYLVAGTIYIDAISESGGPVHWHTDFEVYGCDERIDIIDPKGLSNRVGTPVFHEHDDDRIHIEGVIVEGEDVFLQRFFSVVGGSLTETSFSLPTNYGDVSYAKGDLCDGQPGTLQAFVYKTDGTTVTQTKLTPPDMIEYIPSPYSLVPPGDCLIIEFGVEKERTNHMCTTYRIDIEQGKLNYGS